MQRSQPGLPPAGGHTDVYPGPLAFLCPEEGGIRLGPGSSATATGSWDQGLAVGSEGAPATLQHAPPGRYRLTVDRAVSVPVTLVPG